MDISEFKRELYNPSCKDLAFVVGNGINRYNNPNQEEIGWDRMLERIWKDVLGTDIDLKSLSDGISYTEIFDLMELDTFSDIKKEIKDDIKSHVKESRNTKRLQNVFISLDFPVLTTNFDTILSKGMKKRKLGYGDKTPNVSDYPWNIYFRKDLLNSDATKNFAIWHINGIVDNKNTIRLGQNDYVKMLTNARSYLSKLTGPMLDNPSWKGYNTWLRIFMKSRLCIFGLGLGRDEVFLRWLLLERQRFYKKNPALAKRGWFLQRAEDKTISDGQQKFFAAVGLKVVVLPEDDIYKTLLDK